ncbi:uncharacterized protein F5Z01DRAFT_330151 [Emericellopsis atlantica]|uniref:Uncharacterized protein n=1 Tax=Emericellopsis atlantica TaxID=2614577 RepID=A0A9P7ZGB3_9HYPO|nr:uncharacterized protein F5Z01DRAFT_330151 [Emericellopsis atlantica]KAG9251045.1 hypothetical protein F5Z01DRAFT_330151 [Emericellopsis atlantica]
MKVTGRIIHVRRGGSLECGRFHTYTREWIQTEEGDKCAACYYGAYKCAIIHCVTHHACFGEGPREDIIDGSVYEFCFVCDKTNRQRVNRGRAKAKDFRPKNRAIKGTRVCVNPACAVTEKDWPWNWRYEAGHRNDTCYLRCEQCHVYLRDNGRERQPANFWSPSQGPRQCCICSVEENLESPGMHTFHRKKDQDGEWTGTWRCGACHCYYMKYQDERSESKLKRKPIPSDRRCFNSICVRTGENHKNWSRYSDDGNEIWRCGVCAEFFDRTGNDRTTVRVMNRKNEYQECGNPSCDRTTENYTGRWLYLTKAYDDPTQRRCRRCREWVQRNTEEWSEERQEANKAQRGASLIIHMICGNPKCDSTSDNYSGRWKIMGGRGADESTRRCMRCASSIDGGQGEWDDSGDAIA